MARTTASSWAAASGACCETRTRCEAKRSLAGSGSSWRTTLEGSERSSAPRPTRKERVFDRPDPACPAASGRLGAAGGPVLAATCGARSRLESERPARLPAWSDPRSEEHTSELQSLAYLVCRLLLEKKKKRI